ncbi:metal-dependent hydrolase [Halomicroarcula sp. GCM10025709]|uniref:metal-dependent hydrolase n=1 Tax=Halomicroarcula sp. GCM10025709 TaxID=3252669 RepID=UPI00360BDABC
MWPWGHAAVGYLLYSLGCQATGRRVVAAPGLALAVGTQFPDLVDKPLGWTLGILPGGRTLAHSLLTFVIVSFLLGLLARRYGRAELGVAFVVGYLSHTLSDGLYAVIEGEIQSLSYLLWPLFTMPPVETAQTFSAHFATLVLGPYVLFELLLACLAAIRWYVDGRPGLEGARRLVHSGHNRLQGFAE